MIRVLQILSSLRSGGGIQAMLLNYYLHMDLSNLQTDFIVCGDEVGEMESWFLQRGSKIYHIPSRAKHTVENLLKLQKIIKNGNYDVVHCHQDYRGAAAIAIARHYGVEKRIVHSHQAYPPENAMKKLRRNLSMKVLLRNATDFFACSELAGKWLCGERMLEEGRVTVLRNAIPTEEYVFSGENRRHVRETLGIDEDTIALGHVGRFSFQKNHALVLKIFNAFHQTHKKAILMLVGGGELMPEVKKQAADLGIESAVCFLGVRQDVPTLLSAMDVLLLPSRWEGLPVTVVEAQANGLPTVCSGQISREIRIADNVFFVSESSYEELDSWCNTVDMAISAGRGDYRQSMIRSGYDISREAKKLEEFYLT